MTDTSTEDVKALMNGVTPGDWRFFQGEDDAGKAYFGVTASSGDICSMSNAYEWRGKQAIANARFIEAARDLVPALLSERDDLRDKLNALPAEVAPHDPAKVQALVEAASALERNLGINGVNVGSLRVNLFAALAAMKEG